MRGLFVTGTDTGVGKTVLSAALLAAMAAAGERVRAHKPVVTGLDEPDSELWPPDHVMLARAAAMEPEAVAPLRYGPAVSPHLAAELAGERIDSVRVLAAARSAGAHGASAPTDDAPGEDRGDEILVVEGVGGLLVPLAEDYAVRDLAGELRLPLVLAARAGLGTINHTLLTLEAARSAGLDVRAVVLTPWPREPSRIERSNRATVERIGGVEVGLLGPVPGPDLSALARAGGQLPWRRWLSGD